MVEERKKNNNELKIRGIKFFLTFGFSGLSPIMPGTVGSLIALIPIFLLNYFVEYTTAQIILLIALSIAFYLGVVWSRDHARLLFGKEDPPQIVIDEVVGVGVAVWLWDYTPLPEKWVNLTDFGWLVSAFILFRFFDITKIGGIKRLEKIPNGWGVMLDDLAAGLSAWGILRIGNLLF